MHQEDLEKYHAAARLNREALREIVSENSETEFGRAHHFSEIQDIDMFRSSVPISTYEDYEEAIGRMYEGAVDVLTSYDIKAYCYTTGTTGQGRKLFPVTTRQLAVYGNRIDAYADDLYKKVKGKRFFPQTFRLIPSTSEAAPEPTIITELLHCYKAGCGAIDYDAYVGGYELMFDRQAEDAFFAKCYAALLTPDITIMEAVYFFDHLHFFTYLEQNCERVLTAIKTRQIPEDIRLSSSMRDRILSMPVDEDRLSAVSAELGKGFHNIAGRLWPKLRLMTGISTQAYFSENEMMRLYAPDVPHYYNYYMSTESYMGECVGEDAYDYVLLPGYGFYEFLPLEEGKTPQAGEREPSRTLLPHELKPGQTVEPVITNFSGLYRYRIGDVLLVRDFIGESPVFEFVRRRGVAISIAGERMTVTQLEESMKRLTFQGIGTMSYCFAPALDRKGARYRLVLVRSDAEPAEIPVLLDRILCEQNDGYADLRALHYLDAPEVWETDADTYFTFMQKNGMLDGNKKPRHIAPGGFKEWE